jgi:hypothetical protein
MSEKKTWTELREQRARRAAVRAGYEEAQRAYDIGRQVRSLREARDLSQRELAERNHLVGHSAPGGRRQPPQPGDP